MGKKKIIKIFLLVILLFFIAFIVYGVRNAIILSDIDKKVSNLENNKQNIYFKSISKTSEYTLEIERFIKDDVDKLVLNRKNKDGTESSMIQYDNSERHRVYNMKDGNIVLMTDTVYEGVSPKPIRKSHLDLSNKETPCASYTVLPNAGYSDSFLEKIINSVFTTLKIVEIDGKECYEISGKYSSSTLYNENTKKVLVYVEKETGLTIKRVETVEENGQIIENITNYEYNFDSVTNENIKEPN